MLRGSVRLGVLHCLVVAAAPLHYMFVCTAKQLVQTAASIIGFQARILGPFQASPPQ